MLENVPGGLTVVETKKSGPEPGHGPEPEPELSWPEMAVMDFVELMPTDELRFDPSSMMSIGLVVADKLSLLYESKPEYVPLAAYKLEPESLTGPAHEPEIVVASMKAEPEPEIAV